MRQRVYVLTDNGNALGVFWSVSHADWAAREMFNLNQWAVTAAYIYGEQK